ncbi:MAG: helix-turn-helix domain-containing protein [Oscillospiraceae bacterium]|nr:helix-turn-helix domain-containing protein [Oscillospiraceae bacterium]
MPKEDFIRNRITQLRMNKNISEYQMSLDLGHSKSYIQSISSGRAMPSMNEFLSICEYLGVTPQEFFDEHTKNPILRNTLINEINSLSESDIMLILELIKRLKS